MTREIRQPRIELKPQFTSAHVDQMAKDLYDLRLDSGERLQLLEELKRRGNPHHVVDQKERRHAMALAAKKALKKTPTQLGLRKRKEKAEKNIDQSFLLFLDAARKYNLEEAERAKVIPLLREMHVDFFDPDDLDEGIRDAVEMLKEDVLENAA